MAAKVTASAGASGRDRRWWGTLAIGLMLGAVVWFWLSGKSPTVVRLDFPTRPDFSGKPAELGERVAQAEAQARNRTTAIEGTIKLGSLYHANGYLTEASACWRLLGSEQPSHARWPYLLADLRRRESDYPAMVALLEKTTALDPHYAPAWLRLADYEFKTGALDAAAQHYAKRLALLPRDPHARLGLIRIALQQGRREDARGQVEALIADEPRFSSARNLYAEMLAAAGDRDGARLQRWLGREAGRFREADDPWLDDLVSSCRDPQALQLLATVQFQTGRTASARASMERAVQLAPKDPNLLEAAGDLYLKLGNPGQARDALEAGVAAAGSTAVSIPHYVHLNQAYRQLPQPAEAVRVVQQGLARYPEAFELHNALGLTLEESNRPQEAQAAFRRSVELNPNDAESNFNLAASLLQQAQFDEARVHLKRALTLQPTFPKALKVLAKLELDAGRPEAATEFLLPLYEAQTGDPQVRDLMVEWHLLARRSADARKILQEGLAVARLTGNAAEAAYCEETLKGLR